MPVAAFLTVVLCGLCALHLISHTQNHSGQVVTMNSAHTPCACMADLSLTSFFGCPMAPELTNRRVAFHQSRLYPDSQKPACSRGSACAELTATQVPVLSSQQCKALVLSSQQRTHGRREARGRVDGRGVGPVQAVCCPRRGPAAARGPHGLQPVPPDRRPALAHDLQVMPTSIRHPQG